MEGGNGGSRPSLHFSNAVTGEPNCLDRETAFPEAQTATAPSTTAGRRPWPQAKTRAPGTRFRQLSEFLTLSKRRRLCRNCSFCERVKDRRFATEKLPNAGSESNGTLAISVLCLACVVPFLEEGNHQPEDN